MNKNDNIVRCLITLTPKQKDSLDLLARNICRHRNSHKNNAKITSSTIIRCLIDIFMSKWDDFKTDDILSEKQLFHRIKETFL